MYPLVAKFKFRSHPPEPRVLWSPLPLIPNSEFRAPSSELLVTPFSLIRKSPPRVTGRAQRSPRPLHGAGGQKVLRSRSSLWITFPRISNSEFRAPSSEFLWTTFSIISISPIVENSAPRSVRPARFEIRDPRSENNDLRFLWKTQAPLEGSRKLFPQ